MGRTKFSTTIYGSRKAAEDRFENEGDCIGTVYKTSAVEGADDEILGYVVLSEEMRVLDFFEQQISDEIGCECYVTPDDDWYTDDEEE